MVRLSRLTQTLMNNPVVQRIAKLPCFLTPWLPGSFQPKTSSLHVLLHGNISTDDCAWELFKSSKDSANLRVCNQKKILGWGLRIFCEWRHKWRIFRPPWPTSPGPGPKPLDGNISLKFLLETRLQSESFDTLDDLLGLRVQKLWSKVNKISD